MTLAELKEWHLERAQDATTRAAGWREHASTLAHLTPLRAERFGQVAGLCLEEAAFHANAAELIEGGLTLIRLHEERDAPTPEEAGEVAA